MWPFAKKQKREASSTTAHVVVESAKTATVRDLEAPDRQRQRVGTLKLAAMRSWIVTTSFEVTICDYIR